MRDIYTDLALEIAEQLSDESGIDGVDMDIEKVDCIKVTTIKVTNEAGANAMGKPVGNYITIESPAIKEADVDSHEQIMRIMVDKLAAIRAGLNIAENASVLVIGLGNQDVTPDALGPQVVSKILVTRHIIDSLPKSLLGGLRSLSALSPGVMGQTGIETAEIVKGLVQNTNPDLVIAVDALAARNISRINQTIQIADTGISPGAGVGNHRTPLNQKTLGVPVIAIGVPTVADASTFVNDALDMFLAELAHDSPASLKDGADFFAMLNELEDIDKKKVIKNTLDPVIGSMFVTPKEIGEVVRWLSNIIANAINMSMHKGITKDDINRFMH